MGIAQYDVDAVKRLISEFGWTLLHLDGCYADGSCGCYKRSECPSPGKHPKRGVSWDFVHTVDDVDRVIAGGSPVNFGLCLGEKYGIIDIEYDSSDGEELLEGLLGPAGETATPTFRSRRGVHRLFRYDSRLPQQARAKLPGADFLIGAGDNSNQMCVAPPSRIFTDDGVELYYSWLEGRAPWEVELADVPESVIEILNSEQVPLEERKPRCGDSSERPADWSPKPPTGDNWKQHLALLPTWEAGYRNDYTAKYAASHAHDFMGDINDADQREVFVEEVLAVVERKAPFDGKWTEREARQCIRSIISRYLINGERKRRSTARQAAEEVAGDVTQVDGYGVSLDDDRFVADSWHITIVKSDPPRYLLEAPFLADLGVIDVELSVDDYMSATAVAQEIFRKSRILDLASPPGVWKTVWDGKPKSKSKPKGVKGLRSYLLEQATTVEPAGDDDVDYTMEAYLISEFENAKEYIAGETAADARVFKGEHGEYYIRPKELAKAVASKADCRDRDVSTFLRRCGFNGEERTLKVNRRGKPSKYMRVTVEMYERLRNRRSTA